MRRRSAKKSTARSHELQNDVSRRLCSTVQLSQLRFRLFESRPPGRGKVPACAVDVEVQHRHRRLKGSALPAAASLGGSLEGQRDLARIALSEDARLETEGAARLGHALGPALASGFSCLARNHATLRTIFPCGRTEPADFGRSLENAACVLPRLLRYGLVSVVRRVDVRRGRKPGQLPAHQFLVENFLLAELREEFLDVEIGHVFQRFGEEGLGLPLGLQSHFQRLAIRHEGAGLLVFRSLHVPQKRAVNPARLVSEEGPAPVCQLLAMPLLVDDHGPEESGRLVGVLILHLLGELEVTLARLLLDENGEIQGVPQVELLEVERIHIRHLFLLRSGCAFYLGRRGPVRPKGSRRRNPLTPSTYSQGRVRLHRSWIRCPLPVRTTRAPTTSSSSGARSRALRPRFS